MLMGFKLDVTPVMVTTGAARSNITWFQKPFSMEASVCAIELWWDGSFEDERWDRGWKLGVWEKPRRFRQHFVSRHWAHAFKRNEKKNPFVRAKDYWCCPLGALEKFCAACIIKEERKDGVIWLLQKKNEKKNEEKKTPNCALCNV